MQALWPSYPEASHSAAQKILEPMDLQTLFLGAPWPMCAAIVRVCSLAEPGGVAARKFDCPPRAITHFVVSIYL